MLHAGLLSIVAFWALNVQFSGDVVDSRYLWLWLALFEIQARLAARGEIGCGSGS
jgi:hypothetical protein